MESETKTDVKKRLVAWASDVSQDTDGIKARSALNMIRQTYKWLPRVLQTRYKNTIHTNLAEPRAHSSREPGNSVTHLSTNPDAAKHETAGTNDTDESDVGITPKLLKRALHSSESVKKQNESDSAPVPAKAASHRSAAGHREEEDFTILVTHSSENREVFSHRKSDRKDRSDLKVESPKSLKHKRNDKRSPKIQNEHKNPVSVAPQTTTSVPPVTVNDGNENPSSDPYKDIRVSDRHPKCYLSLEEVKRKAERIPKCLGSRARANYVRQIYVCGMDPDTWDWGQYDHAFFISEPIDVIKGVPRGNCQVSRRRLEKMARILPNSISRKCFLFLCSYRGLDPEETLKQIEKNPLYGICPEPLKVIEEYQNPDAPPATSSLPPVASKKEAGNRSSDPYDGIDFGGRHPKCKLTLEEVKRKAEKIPSCLGRIARVYYIRKIYERGWNPDFWNWSLYDYTFLLSESVVVIKDVPHRNCRASLSKLRKMAKTLPNYNSKECFIFLCFYRGLDPDETLRKIKKNPLLGDCAEPWKALKQYQDQQNPEVLLQFCKEKKKFRCVKVEVKSSCDHFLCSARSGSQAVGCLFEACVPALPAGTKDTPATPAASKNIPVDIPQPSSDHLQNLRADIFDGGGLPVGSLSASSPSGSTSNPQAEIQFSKLGSSEVGNQPFLPPPSPPGSPLSRLPELVLPPSSNLPTHSSPKSSEPVEMDWVELESPEDENHLTSGDIAGINVPDNLDAVHAVPQNLSETSQVTGRDSPVPNASDITISGPVSQNTSSTMEQLSSSPYKYPLCGQIPLFIEPIDYPDTQLSNEQMSAIEGSILEAILEMPVAENGDTPKFVQSIRSNGRYGITCCDEFSRKWIFAYLGTHKPCPDVSLRIVEPKDISDGLPLQSPLPLLPLPQQSEPKINDRIELESREHEDQQKSRVTTANIVLSNIDLADPMPSYRSSTVEESGIYKYEPNHGQIPVFIEPIDYPNSHLSDEQMSAIQNGILDAILEIPEDEDDVKPKFLQSIRCNGRYSVTCSDDFSRKWLYAFLGTHRPCPDVSLRIVSMDFRDETPQQLPLPLPPPPPPPLLSELKDQMELESVEQDCQQKSGDFSINVNLTSTDDLSYDPVLLYRSSTVEGSSRRYENEPSRRHIPVFIEPIDYPSSRLSDEQMTAIEKNIHEAMSEIDKESPKPKFLQSIRRNGRYGVTCSDDFSRKWLYAYLGTHKPWPNSSLRIVSKHFAEIRASAVLPLCQDEDNERILKLIGTQNEGLDVSKWEVVQRWESGGSRTCMDLVIDEDSARVLDSRSKIIFKMGTGLIVTAQKKLTSEETSEFNNFPYYSSGDDEIYEELLGDQFSAESAKPAEFDLLEHGIHAEFFGEEASLKNSSVADLELHRGDDSHERLMSNSEDCVSMDHTKLDCLRSESEKSQSSRNSSGCSSGRSIEEELCQRDGLPFSIARENQSSHPDEHVDCRYRASGSPLDSSRLECPSPKDGEHWSSLSSPSSVQSVYSERSSASQSKQDMESFSGRRHPKAYSSNNVCRPLRIPLPYGCSDEEHSGEDSVDSEVPKGVTSRSPTRGPIYSEELVGKNTTATPFYRQNAPAHASEVHSDERVKDGYRFSHTLPDTDRESSTERVSSPKSPGRSLDVHRSRDPSPMVSDSQDSDDESSNSPICFLYDPDRPIQEQATEQFRKLIAAGYSCQEALKITQDFVSRHLDAAPPTQPEPPKASLPRPCSMAPLLRPPHPVSPLLRPDPVAPLQQLHPVAPLLHRHPVAPLLRPHPVAPLLRPHPIAPLPQQQPEPTLHEVATDKFNKLVAAGFSIDKAVQFTEAFVRRQMGLLPPPTAISP